MTWTFARISTLIAVTVISSGCGGPGGSTTESRTSGELAFRRHCQTCHSLPRPTKYTDSEWPSLVARYGSRAKLTDSTIALITLHLTAHN